MGLNWSEGRRRGGGGGEGGVSACDVNGCVEEERTAEQARVYLFIVVVHLTRGRRTAEGVHDWEIDGLINEMAARMTTDDHANCAEAARHMH